MARTRRSFGLIDQLPSGRHRARYTGPDGKRHSAPHTFDTKTDAETWLSLRQAEIVRQEWTPASAARTTFGEYAEPWLADRQLKGTTRQHYRKLLDRQILPTFADVPLRAITPPAVRKWHASLPADRPTLRAHAYGLLRTIMQTALHDGEISANPVHIRGAGSTKRVVKIEPASLKELEILVDTMTDERYRMMTLLAAWCGMRFGELTELRRKDVDLKAGVVKVRRAVSRVGGRFVVGTPKSDAGVRDVAIPPPPAARAGLLHRHQRPEGRQGETALSRLERPDEAHGTGVPVQGLLPCPRRCRAPGPPLPRPPPHRCRPRRPDRRDTRRAHGSSRPLDARRRHALPARRSRS